MSNILVENIKVYERFLKKNNLYQSGQLNIIQLGGNETANTDPFYFGDVEQLTKDNNDYRRVLFTGQNQQFVLMSISPQDNIPMEIHESHDQFIRIEQGEGEAIIGEKKYILKDNTAFIVPAGVKHEISNTSKTEPLKLYTIYSPPEHKDKLVQQTNPNRQIKSIDLKDVDIYSDSEKGYSDNLGSEESISQSIIENELKQAGKEVNELKGGYNKLNKKNNLDYNKKYTDYKNKYITLKNFISKYYE